RAAADKVVVRWRWHGLRELRPVVLDRRDRDGRDGRWNGVRRRRRGGRRRHRGRRRLDLDGRREHGGDAHVRINFLAGRGREDAALAGVEDDAVHRVSVDVEIPGDGDIRHALTGELDDLLFFARLDLLARTAAGRFNWHRGSGKAPGRGAFQTY